MKVYDLMGKEIVTLVDEPLPPGTHEAVFDGRALASGVYFCRLQISGRTYLQAMMLLR